MEPIDEDLQSMDGDEVMKEEDDYESMRQETIRQNNALLASLGLPELNSKPVVTPAVKSVKTGKENGQSGSRIKRAARIQVEPTRRSSRVASQGSKETLPSRSLSPSRPSLPSLPKAKTPRLPPAPSYDSTEEKYTQQRIPSRKADGTLVFEGRWKGVFTPNLTPEEMFSGGAFGGAFYCDTYSQVLHRSLPAKADISALPFPVPPSLLPKLKSSTPDPELNRFKVKAGQSLQEWEKSGWIWAGDPRGWAEWFVRFWAGRRCEDDERQVKRWLNLAGPSGRFKRALLKRIQSTGGDPTDEDVGRVLRQCLWQWGYDLKKSDWEAAIRG